VEHTEQCIPQTLSVNESLQYPMTCSIRFFAYHLHNTHHRQKELTDYFN